MLHFVRNLMLDKGYWSERTVLLEEVEAFIEKLRPMQASVPLRRLGSANDGGYLIPDDLDGISACVSPGVWIECSFDEAVADLGLDVHIADASVDGPPAAHDRFRFSRLSFDTCTSGDRITIDDFCRGINPGEDLLLDMDIEGAEYRVLNTISDDLLARFRIMTIEFHHLGNLHTPFGLSEISAVFDRLLRSHHVVHIHPNNAVQPVSRGHVSIPPVMEFTFLRKDRATFVPARGPYPLPLDAPTNLGMPEIALPPCWYAPQDAV